MFVLKGIISFFFKPLSIFILVLLVAGYLYKKGSLKWAQRFFIASFVWLFLVSYQPLSEYLLSLLESQYSQVSKQNKDAKYILALGGDSDLRTHEALRLYYQNKNLKIITSGYEPYGSDGAFHTARLLREAGVPTESIEEHAQSKDTIEEALMLKNKGLTGPFYLITSAYHMPRAMAIFKKQGLHPIATPTNFLQTEAKWHQVFNVQALAHNEIVFHELLGLIWYKLKGYI